MADPAGWRCIHSKNRSRNKAAYVVGGLGQEMDKKKSCRDMSCQGRRRHPGSKMPKDSLTVAPTYTPHFTQHCPAPNMSKSRREAEAEVRSWGFDHVFTWTDSP
jgi:hypothetical protein